MKKAKLLLSALMLISVVGCGGTPSSSTSSENNNSTTQTSLNNTSSSSSSGEEVTVEKISASATKHYNIGDPIDKTAFEVYAVNKNGTKTKVDDFEVTLSEETASLTSKATIKANNLEDTIAIPLTSVLIEAENCTNTTDNYRLFAKEGTYKIEAGQGEDGTASFGFNSSTRNTKTNPGVDTELTFTIESGCEQEVSLYMNAASTLSNADKKMDDAIIEDALDMTLNGEPAAFLPDAVLLGDKTTSWFNWKLLKIATLKLIKGTNTIDIKCNYKDSVINNPQKSGDGPFNVDYFIFQYGDNIQTQFDANGPETTINNQVVKMGEKLTKPEDPKYSYTDARGNTYNFVLENWYNGENVWDFNKDIVKRPMTLKAKWTFEDDFFAIKENLDVRTEGTTARIMSFNVLADDWNNKPAVDDTRANQGFNTIERYQPDVVGLQEFDDAWYTKATTLLDGYTIVNADSNKVTSIDNKQYTNYSTLAYNTSTVKLIEYEQVALKTNDNKYCRNVTTGLFEFIAGENIGKQFVVTSTHWDLKEPQRVLQASEMSQIIKNIEEKYPNTPIMSCGDYNAKDSQSPITTFVSESGMYDTKNAETKGLLCNTGHLGDGMRVGDRVTTNPQHWLRGPISFLPSNVKTEECIDHIFATTNVKSLYATTIVDEDALNASDHCPIISDLQF